MGSNPTSSATVNISGSQLGKLLLNRGIEFRDATKTCHKTAPYCRARIQPIVPPWSHILLPPWRAEGTSRDDWGARDIQILAHNGFAAAKRLVAFESADADARIAEARRKFETVAKPTMRHDAPSRAEIHAMVERWFIGLEKESTEWWEQSGQFLDDQDRAEVLDGLRTDFSACGGRSGQYMLVDFGFHVDHFLAERGLAFPTESAAYKSLCDLFKCARLENIQRQMDRVEGTQLHAHNPLFQQLFAHSEPKSSDPVSITLGELLARYMRHAETRLTETTRVNYRTVMRIIREVIGDKTPLNKIGRSQMEDVFAMLKQMPVNAIQKYPGLSIQETIAAAEAR